jgi:hypothetical protein
MRVLLIAAALLVSGCASSAIVDHEAPTPVWRMDTSSLQHDRQLARNCLSQSRQSCDDVIQQDCTGGDGGEATIPAAMRRCDWRAIAAWEDEIEDMLTRLRGALSGRNLSELEASQRAWSASMLADVAAAMDLYEGGSLAGPVGAHMRAQASAYRARYLADLLLMLE